MKRLFLLRHAKSLRDESMNDKDRPLNARGRADAPTMGAYMHKQRYIPDRVLCSSAKRTVETWMMLAPELETAPQPTLLDSLYLAASGSIVRIIRQDGREATALLVIGHNPGLEDAARKLIANPLSVKERELVGEIETKFPTGALAVLEFDIQAWSEVAEGAGKLVDFARPKHLPR
jgi:phosphohistidine phosphatase